MDNQQTTWIWPTIVPDGCEYERYIPPSQKDIDTLKHYAIQQQTFRDAIQTDMELIELIQDKISWRKKEIMKIEQVKFNRKKQQEIRVECAKIVLPKDDYIFIMNLSEYPIVIPETPENRNKLHKLGRREVPPWHKSLESESDDNEMNDGPYTTD